MIGPLFIASGVSAASVVGGLFVGNLLAVLSWLLLTAPIATRARMTLYFQLEKICGRNLVTAYNLANGVMFCFLAGAMVTVNATALGVWFDISMPALNDTYPNSVGWVAAVLVMGALISVVAAYGYKVVARIANIAAPWMVLVFIAYGIVAAHQLGINSVGEFWPKAKELIWTGGAPLAGRAKFTFWHVMFFAWFCNMAMHIGMADLSVFRYAKKSWYAVATAAGMYLGHFIAWLSASILYALQLHQTPGNTDVLPGPLAYQRGGHRGPHLRHRGRLDDGQSDDLPRGPGVPGHRAEVLALQGDAAHGSHRHDCRAVSRHRDETARLRGPLRPGADADGGGGIRGLLAGEEARLPPELR